MFVELGTDSRTLIEAMPGIDRLSISQAVQEAGDAHALGIAAVLLFGVPAEKDEAGCLRFNVLQDGQDENVYYFYEVYKDEAALEAHRKAPHYAVWRAAADALDGPTEPVRCKTVFPADRGYWGKP